jgi:cytochrome P450
VGKDLLSLIVKANMASDLQDSQRLSDEEIIYQISTFLAAGSETSSNGLSWCLWRLAQDQNLQQRLRDELATIGDSEPTFEALNALPLLENVIRETLRLDSPVPETIREATADCHVPISQPIIGNDGTPVFSTSIPIKKGTMVIEPFTAVHRDHAIWGADAEEFNPDRYDRPNYPATKIPGSYGNLLSFNGGARNCM